MAGAPFVVAASTTGDVGAAALDTGNYPITPTPTLGTAGSATYGRILEGYRMANYVVVPNQVDPGLLRARPQNTFVLRSADDLPDPLPPEQPQHFVVGFSTARSSAGPRSQVLINVVLRFTDAAAAGDAASAMAAYYSGVGVSRSTVTVWIPGHPNTSAFQSEADDGAALSSVTARGSYVLYQYAVSDGLDKASTLVAKTLDVQEPMIDRFVPVDSSRLADLPADPTGLMRRTLPMGPTDAPFNHIRVYQAAAALHVMPNPSSSAALFTAAGVDAVSLGKTTVIEAANSVGAQRIADTLAASRENSGYHPAAGGIGLASARCFDGGRDGDTSPRRFYCVGLASRYAFEVFSDQERDAHQQVAAQYRILTGQ